jgi:penicillin V acylase-like amidase (Ntn superfamily)
VWLIAPTVSADGLPLTLSDSACSSSSCDPRSRFGANVPLGASEGIEEEKTSGMRSSTLWTSGYVTKNLVMYYHTQNNRRVRRVDLKKIDFTALGWCFKTDRQPALTPRKPHVDEAMAQQKT